MSVKGSWQRADVDKSKFNEEYDRIFGKGHIDKLRMQAPLDPLKGLENDYVFDQEDLGDVNDTDK